MSDATAVWLGGKLYVGGGTSDCFRLTAMLYIYTPTADMWDFMDTPVYWFALTTYHFQLVLIGGKESSSNDEFTNKLWTLSEHGQWQETLPHMISKRHSACAVSYGANHLLVAGGIVLEGISNTVEVYDGEWSRWLFAQSLPFGYYDLKSVILDDINSEQPVNKCWYLMGGCGCEERAVYYATLDSLVATTMPSETLQPSPSIWKRLTDAPNPFNSTAVFGTRLINVGGKGISSSTSTIHAYSFQTNSWIHVGDMPFGASSTCSVVLPTGELMVVGGNPSDPVRNVMKAEIKGNNHC